MRHLTRMSFFPHFASSLMAQIAHFRHNAPLIHVGFYVCPGHEMLDLAGPHCAFQSALTPSGAQAYSLHVISAWGGYVPGNAGLGVSTTRAGDVALDTLIMVGGKIAPMFEPQ